MNTKIGKAGRRWPAREPRVSSLAGTAHELRTPLTSVVAALEILQTCDVTAAEAAELIEQATTAAHQLAYLVDDILDNSALAVDRLRVARAPHDAGELLAEVRRVMTLQARPRGITLDVALPAAPIAVDTDARRMLQVAVNLVGNAIKYSPDGSTVTVRVQTTAAAVRFLICDEGPGLRGDVRAELFAPYSGAATGGTGLGLFLCRALVGRLGGRLGHVPRPRGGSIFWFELPRAIAEAGGSPP